MSSKMLLRHISFKIVNLLALSTISTIPWFTSAENENTNVTTAKESQHIGALLRFCLDHQPDGTALLTSSSGQEILALFKLDRFWLQPTTKLLEFIESRTSTQKGRLFNYENALSVSDRLSEYPSAPDHIVSFTGMNKDHPFYNNILVFKENTFTRYRVKHLKLSDSVTEIITQLLGTYSTNLWFNLPNLNTIQTITILRGSRALIILYSEIFGVFSRAVVYILNEANLENPVHHIAYSHQLPGIDGGDKTTIKFYYQLNSNQTLYLKSSGLLCLDNQCEPIHKAIGCEPNVQAFLGSFAYWLWKETDLTIRLLIIALAAVGMVNFIIALSFIHFQLKKMSDLV